MPSKKEATTRKELAKRKRMKWFFIGLAATVLIGLVAIIATGFFK